MSQWVSCKVIGTKGLKIAKMNSIDSIVVGAGLGCAMARYPIEAGRKVLVLEKRPVVDGNMRCECVDGAPWEENLLW